MTFWIGAPLSKWRSYEVRLWAKNAPLRCIIVSKNAPKFLIKPEAPCSKSLHKPLVSRDQGDQRSLSVNSETSQRSLKGWITKSQQEWLPGGEKAGAGQRSRLEQSKRENSEARTLVTQANNSLSTNGNSPEPENTCLPQLWPFSTSRKFVTVPIASQENPCRVKYIYQLLWWTVLFFAPLLQS